MPQFFFVLAIFKHPVHIPKYNEIYGDVSMNNYFTDFSTC
jgi:hypothetical protein